MTLDEIKTQSKRLSSFAHLATIGADNEPDVVPVHPAWEGDVMWVMVDKGSVKARNIGANSKVALHWQVSEAGDGVAVWGTAEVVADVDTKRRLWTGTFGYDLNLFSPGGPENSPETVFIAVRPDRALYLETYGKRGRHTWKRDG